MSNTSIFVFIGLDTARQAALNIWPENDNGLMGVASACAAAAVVVDKFLEEDLSENYPGVFHYEVTEQLGGWLYDNINATSEQVAQQLHSMVEKWRGKEPTFNVTIRAVVTKTLVITAATEQAAIDQAHHQFTAACTKGDEDYSESVLGVERIRNPPSIPT
jgi:hypothetical protein